MSADSSNKPKGIRSAGPSFNSHGRKTVEFCDKVNQAPKVRH